MPNQVQLAHHHFRSHRGTVYVPHNAQPKPFPFLRLPGELRNRIYDLVFEERRIGLWRTHPRRELQRSKLAQNAPRPLLFPSKGKVQCVSTLSLASMAPAKICRPRLAHIDLPLAHLPLDNASNPRKPSRVSIELLLTCRQICEEAITYLYGNTQFVFKSPNTVCYFLKGASEVGLQAIRRIEIHHNTYGEPRLTEHCVFKERSDEKWFRACVTISERLVGLQELVLKVRICDWPTKLELTTDWAIPLLTLGERKLDRADVTLKHKAFNEGQCKVAAEGLEDRLMTQEGIEKKEAERAILEVKAAELTKMQRTQAGLPKAKRTLVIKEVNILDKIAKVNPYVWLG